MASYRRFAQNWNFHLLPIRRESESLKSPLQAPLTMLQSTWVRGCFSPLQGIDQDGGRLQLQFHMEEMFEDPVGQIHLEENLLIF